jgi:hypothetical protein
MLKLVHTYLLRLCLLRSGSKYAKKFWNRIHNTGESTYSLLTNVTTRKSQSPVSSPLNPPSNPLYNSHFLSKSAKRFAQNDSAEGGNGSAPPGETERIGITVIHSSVHSASRSSTPPLSPLGIQAYDSWFTPSRSATYVCTFCIHHVT